MEVSNLPNKKFNVMTQKILTELRSKTGEYSENFNKEKI